jgi:glutamine amidotransferase
MVTTIAVVDHGAGNLVSIAQGLERVEADVIVATEPGQMDGVDGVVLPGVGSTAAAMHRISEAGFIGPLTSMAVPLLGVCVGMQVLFDTSDEDGAACLGIMSGIVRELKNTPTLPHIGWNDVTMTDDPLFAGFDSSELFYFAHSYAPVPIDASITIGTSTHGETFVAAVRQGSVAGVQFHPERSGDAGIKLLSNFVRNCEEVQRAA